MPERNSHVIRRQVFELKYPKRTDGFAMQKEVGRIATEELAPALEALFDRFASPDELIRFGKLEIDVGTIPVSQLEEALVQAVVSKVENALLQNIVHGTQVPGVFTRQSTVSGLFQAWLFFLKTGYLPWHVTGAAAQDFHVVALQHVATDATATGQLRQWLKVHPPAVERLVKQYPESFLVSLLEALTAHAQKQLPAWRAEFQLLFQLAGSQGDPPISIDSRKHYHAFWLYIFRTLLSKQLDRASTESLITAVLPAWFDDIPAKGGQQKSSHWPARESILANQASFPLFATMGHLFPTGAPPISESGGSSNPTGTGADRRETHPAEETKPAMAGGEADDQRPPAAEDTSSDIAFSSVGDPAQPDESPANLSEDTESYSLHTDKQANQAAPSPSGQQKDAGIDEGKKTYPDVGPKRSAFEQTQIETSGTEWYVNTAGIVLLHPFFKSFFANVGLLEKNDFQSDEARAKAVHLLYFLATGETGPPEYDLVLPKFLCGLPFGTPIERHVELPQAWMQEGENLLSAAIKHWNKLGNVSPQGLREGFLVREGKLEKRNDNWYLSVQQQSLDVLLDYLPWNIGLIKLPWMQDLLHIEWA